MFNFCQLRFSAIETFVLPMPYWSYTRGGVFKEKAQGVVYTTHKQGFIKY